LNLNYLLSTKSFGAIRAITFHRYSVGQFL
jgi:hypothetical protein